MVSKVCLSTLWCWEACCLVSSAIVMQSHAFSSSANAELQFSYSMHYGYVLHQVVTIHPAKYWPTHSFSQWASPAQAFCPRFYETLLWHCISHVKSSQEILPIFSKAAGQNLEQNPGHKATVEYSRTWTRSRGWALNYYICYPPTYSMHAVLWI